MRPFISVASRRSFPHLPQPQRPRAAEVEEVDKGIARAGRRHIIYTHGTRSSGDFVLRSYFKKEKKAS